MREAAESFLSQGWMPIALQHDAHGKPKRPIVNEWTSLSSETALQQPWERAKGIGVLLGAPSGNLAVIDIDDNELARLVVDALYEVGTKTRVVWTISHNVHVFVQEEVPSASTAFKRRFNNRVIGIELKSTGTQVATVPTPGYSLALDEPPIQVPSIAAVWASFDLKFGLEKLGGDRETNYPQPWLSTVEKGERNKSVYIEAHHLREAGVPEDMALDFMRTRFESAHTPGEEGWNEVRNTIKSAYRKGVPVQQAVYENLWPSIT